MTLSELQSRVQDAHSSGASRVQKIKLVATRSKCPRWKNWTVNQEFLNLTDAEIEFAIRFELLPRIKWNLSQWVLLILTIASFAFLLYSLELSAPAVYWAAPTALACYLFCICRLGISIGRQKALSLEKVILETQDPISARTYLEKSRGPIYPKKWLTFDLPRIQPLKQYAWYGKDERLKAILKSDLAHPKIEEKP